MKVSDLKNSLQHANDDDNVVIAISVPYLTVGAIPMVTVKSATNGFDWEHGRFILRTEKELTFSDNEFAEQMKKLQDDLGKLKIENRYLKSENETLKNRDNFRIYTQGDVNG